MNIEQKAREVAEAIADSLAKGWAEYKWLFGTVPHGTREQLSALIALGTARVIAAALQSAVAEEAEWWFANPQITQHGPDCRIERIAAIRARGQKETA